MASTTYTIHSARNHDIVTTMEGSTQDTFSAAFERVAAQGDFALGTHRFYVHNGVGVIAAMMMRDGHARQILRDDYMQFGSAGAEKRALAKIG